MEKRSECEEVAEVENGSHVLGWCVTSAKDEGSGVGGSWQRKSFQVSPKTP